MIIILSPSKTMDFKAYTQSIKPTQPLFLSKAASLVSLVRQMDTEDIRRMMTVSGQLAIQTKARFAEWVPEHTAENAKPSIFAFSGDVYEGLGASNFSIADLEFAQKHLVILSGLYGLLRPLDLMMAYRMELGFRWETEQFINLYDYWKHEVNQAFRNALSQSGNKTVINLASQEYSKILDLKSSDIHVITPTFLELREDKLQMVSLFAKRGRGKMAAYIIRNKIQNPEHLKDFNEGNYGYLDEESNNEKLVFAR
jgi:uncharacterized protein